MDLTKERLLSRFASAQGKKADMFMGKGDLTADQTMQPILGDAVVMAHQIDITVLGAATHEDHGAGQWGAQAAQMVHWLYSRAASIYGGSNEIQKNILAKAVLGL